MLLFAIIFITLALILYTIGVWAEKIQGILKLWHVIVFWCGFVCDTVGTSIMSLIAKNQDPNIFHAITGIIAIILMLFHAIWATFVIVKKNKKMLISFHKFSILVWIIWLIPYFSGMIFGMRS